MAATTYSLVMSTYPNQSAAESAVIPFLESGLVACINITPLVTSIYIWEGKVTQAAEVIVYMKTQQDKLANLEKSLLASHPYDTPEFIVLPIAHGNLKYLQWIDKVIK